MKHVIAMSLLCLFFVGTQAKADWSMSVGYNNPIGATVGGINFMHLWTNFAFEFGVGYVKVGKDDKGKDGTILAGDVDMKYLFSSGGFRPYVQVGTGWGFATTGNSAGLGIGSSLYAGGGFFAMGSDVYGYASYNVGSAGAGAIQVGIGFDI